LNHPLVINQKRFGRLYITARLRLWMFGQQAVLSPGQMAWVLGFEGIWLL